jgi:hypothetical protein
MQRVPSWEPKSPQNVHGMSAVSNVSGPHTLGGVSLPFVPRRVWFRAFSKNLMLPRCLSAGPWSPSEVVIAAKNLRCI